MRNNMNMRSGMNRRQFMGAVGAGAAGLAGAAMYGGAVSYAAKPPPGNATYKIGVMASLLGWPPYGESQRAVVEYVIKQEEKKYPGVTFEIHFDECGCGGSINEGGVPKTAFDNFVDLKNLGCKFIIGPSCSGSANYMINGNPSPKGVIQNAWKNTCVLNPGANSDFIDVWIFGGVDHELKDYDGAINTVWLNELKFRSLNSPTHHGSRTIGEHILDLYGPGRNIYILSETGRFDIGVAFGVKVGLDSPELPITYIVCDSYENTLTGFTNAINTIISKNGYDPLNSIFVLNTSSYPDAATAAWESLNPQCLALYGTYSFVTSRGPSGMVAMDIGLNYRGLPDPFAWIDYKEQLISDLRITNQINPPYNGTFMVSTRNHPDPIAAISDSFIDEVWAIYMVDAVKIMTKLIVSYQGKVDAVNAAFNSQQTFYRSTYGTFLGDITWTLTQNPALTRNSCPYSQYPTFTSPIVKPKVKIW